MAGTFPNRQAIDATQLDGLRKLLSAILPGNKFFQRKLSGLSSSLNSLDEFRARVPFTTKPELAADQQANPPFGTNLTFPMEQYTRCHQTSGTSGAPLYWLDDDASWKWMVRNWKRVLEAASVTSRDRVFFAFSFGPFLGFWLAFQAAEELGCLCLPGGGLSSTARLRQIIETGATVVCCTPTYALHLAEVARDENINLDRAKVRLILVAGESGGSVSATRARLTQSWNGARVFDHHGMTEVGAVTFECPARPGVLHVFEESYFAEIIDPVSCKPLTAGQPGELVLTPLGRIGSPVLRYRTGDLVKAASQLVCVCGRSDFALEGGILSRVDDMIVVRGVNIYPSAVEEIIRSIGGIAEYRAHVDTSRSLVELRIEIEPETTARDTSALKEKLEKEFRRVFSMRVPVECVSPGTLPRFELKSHRWLRP